jgi:hypothetical protein
MVLIILTKKSMKQEKSSLFMDGLFRTENEVRKPGLRLR